MTEHHNQFDREDGQGSGLAMGGGPEEGPPPPPIEIPEEQQKYYRKFDFETLPDPIPDSSIRETITTEVIVVGGGISGMATALSAVEKGAKVIMLEKGKACHKHGGDTGFIGSKLQKQLGINIDPDEVVLTLMQYGHNIPDMRLLKLWADGGSETADWWIDIATAAGHQISIEHFPTPPDFDSKREYYPQYLAVHKYEVGSTTCIIDKAIQKGLVIHYNTRARQLLRAGKGRVTGLVAQRNNGDYVKYNALKAVILCTGDYSGNPDMIAKYTPHLSYLRPFALKSSGDGHQMAMWVGAVMERGPHAPISHGNPGPLGTDPFLQVNIRGERFHNEDVPGQSYTNAVERQPEKTAWQVFDSRYPDELPRMGIGHEKFNQMTDDIRKSVEKRAVSANTLKELAEKMQVPVKTFEATVARYNELARLGKDLDFCKRPDRLTAIDKPPYYAGRGFFPLLAIMGGLNANTKMQALDKDGAVIPGLYLAGNTVGNRFAVDYPTIVPGICNGMALHYGRIAGINAATLEP